MFKKVLLGFIAVAALVGVAYAGSFAPFQVNNSNTALSIQQVPIGAGLFVSNINIECDQGLYACGGTGSSTAVARTDTGNGWYYNPATTNCGNANRTGCWQPVVTQATMPPGAAVGNSNYDAPYELIVSPGNTNYLYMIWGGDGCFYYSHNKGSTWTAGGFIIGSSCTASSPNDTTKFYGPFIASDAHNANIVLATTPGSGASYSIDGGQTFNHIAALGSATTGGGASQGGGTVFAFDYSSWSSGNTPGIYACTYGVGVYHTSGGVSGTWTAVPSAPVNTCMHLAVDRSGTLWMTSQNGGIAQQNLYSYSSGGGWVHESPVDSANTQWQSLAIDNYNCPSAGACHILVTDDGGQYIYSVTGSGGFGSNVVPDETNHPPSGVVATDQPWLQNTSNNHWTVGGTAFDPAQSNVALTTTGIGVFSFSPSTTPPGGVYVGTSVTAAMELGNTNWGVAPVNGYPVFTEWDRNGFAITSLTQYPSQTICTTAGGVVAGWSIDGVASTNPASYASICTFGSSYQESAVSSNGGTIWHPFVTQTAGGAEGGCIAMLDANNIMWEPGSTGGGQGVYITSNGGTSWSPLVSPGSLSSGWGGSNVSNRQNCGADRVNGKFYLYNSAGGTDSFWACSTSCGTVGNWTEQCSNCAGSSNSLFGASGQNGVQLRTVTGQAGTIFLTVSYATLTNALYVSTNSGVTWTPVSGFTEVNSIGEGAGCSGHNYEFYVHGVYSSTDALYDLANGGGTPVQIAPYYIQANLAISLDYVKTVFGDNTTCGVVYVGSASQGIVRVKWH